MFRFAAALVVAIFVGAGLSGVASAASCVYDGIDEVTATFLAGESATLAVTGSNEIWFDGSQCGAATNTNTDRILVSGPGGSTEHLIIDQFDGPLAPGATAEGVGISEIEVVVGLGDASDEIVVRGSPDQEHLHAGSNGVGFDDDSDTDITFSPLPNSIELVAAGGMPHVLGVRGGFGAGHVFPGPVTLRAGSQGDSLTGSNFGDLLVGGNGADLIHGSEGPDVIDGGAGNDKLRGADGDDSLAGGPGSDFFNGSYGNDVLDAHDGVADALLNGGPGVDTAAYDRGLDPAPIAVENKFPLDPPPPPPPDPIPVTECSFSDGEVSATIAPGARATLKVSGGLIRFGAPATGCGGATTSNTDRIVVEGPTDTLETLVIDLRGGPLAPGATPEGTGQSEIEVSVELHDVVDLVRVIGPNSRSFFAVGPRGISLNKDDDVDVGIDPDPIMVSLVGGRGRDRLRAAGGFGSGGPIFAGVATLRGGGARDVLVGGKGRDRMWGGKGPDVLRAADHQRDRRLDCDAGRDTVYFDRGRDVPVDCERLRPTGG